MNKSIEIIKSSRRNLISLFHGLSIEQLNEIPTGLNNNLMWHLGHVVVSQQILCYQFSNVQPIIADAYIAAYKSGTRPLNPVHNSEYEILKEYAVALIDRFEIDVKNDVFQNYNSFVHPFYSVEIKNIYDAIDLLSYHDGVHIGYSFALKRLVVQ